MSIPAEISTLIIAIESALADFYDFVPKAHAFEFTKPLSDQSSQTLQKSGIDANRGVTVFAIHNDLIDINIFIAPQILTPLIKGSFNKPITLEHFDALSVLIEEISHFHLIINRSFQGQEMSILEMEYQAEIDKLVIASLLLESYMGKSLFRYLGSLLFAESNAITKGFDNRYATANRMGKIWFDQMLSQFPLGNPLFREQFRNGLIQTYKAPWHKKLQLINLIAS